MKKHIKVTSGFVIQRFVTLGGKHICTEQNFTAGSDVDYEDGIGNPVEVDTTKEQYQPFDMKQPPAPKEDGLKFICPSCGDHRLECCEDGPYVSEILCIDEDGDFDYGEINASGEVDRFQCVDCGYILKDVMEECITDNEDVIEWIKENCKEA